MERKDASALLRKLADTLDSNPESVAFALTTVGEPDGAALIHMHKTKIVHAKALYYQIASLGTALMAHLEAGTAKD